MANVKLKTKEGTFNFDASLIIGLIDCGDTTTVEFESGDTITVGEGFNDVYDALMKADKL